MRYIDEEWNRIELGVRIENLAYNIKVIRALWKLHYGEYGSKSISENMNNPENLYGSLERSQETLRQIELQNYTLKQKSLFDWARRVEEKTGIPGEYLSGQEMINLSCVGGSGRAGYSDYFEEFSSLNDMIEELKQHEYDGIMKKNIKEKAADSIKKMNLRQLDNYIKKQSIVLNEQIQQLAKKAEQSINVIKEYDKTLDDSLRKLLTEDFEIKLEREEKLYRLVYYIYRGKKSGTGDSLSQLIKILKNKRTKDLRGEGEEMLYKYIVALRDQLKLAESIYIVASDCGDFNNEKNLKNILR